MSIEREMKSRAAREAKRKNAESISTPINNESTFGNFGNPVNNSSNESTFATPVNGLCKFGAPSNNELSFCEKPIGVLQLHGSLNRPEKSNLFGFYPNSYYRNSSTDSISQNFEMHCENLNPSRVNEIVDFKNGNLALHYAIIFNNKKCIDILLQKGANAMLKNKDNESAYDCAVKHNNSYFFYKIKDINIEKFNIIKEISDNLKNQIVALDVKNNNLNTIVKDMELRESLLQIQVNELKEKINDNEKNISILTDSNKSLYKDNQTISSSFNSLKNKNNETINNLSELSNDYDSLLNENKEQLIIISNLTKENDNFSNENKKILNDICELKKENDTLLHENNSIKNKIDNLEESYEGLLQKNKKRRLNQ
jgi:hypothetical protein